MLSADVVPVILAKVLQDIRQNFTNLWQNLSQILRPLMSRVANQATMDRDDKSADLAQSTLERAQKVVADMQKEHKD